MVDSVISQVWPSDHFREKQHETVKACIQALENGNKNIVLDAPVGSGKSVVNTALLRYADDGWYTTPQKSLREQVQNDDILESHVENLKARSDYTCSFTGSSCKKCSIYQDQDESCAEKNCNYWRRKQGVMNAKIAVITFSMLTVDSLIPTYVNDMQVSFDDRDMLVVDEVHSLIEQVREMHAGFDVTPYGMPDGVVGGVTDNVSWDASRFNDVKKELMKVKANCKKFYRDIPEFEMSPAEKRCKQLAEKIEQAEKDVSNDYAWVVDVEGREYGNDYVKVLEMRPIYVGNFLKNFVWSRADKRIISTATLRYRNNPRIWIKNAGLDPEKTEVINVGMTFPPKNRPVITNETVCSMKGGGDKENWDDIMDKLEELSKQYYGQKGICHTSSYDRAARVEETVDVEEHPYLHNNIFVHRQHQDADEVLDEWQDSNKDLILSPSMMEGVDLKGDLGRWNVLLKVPYPGQDAWTKYLQDETDYGWHDYYDRAAIRVAQAYGRTNRSKDDYSDFYILDEDFEDLKKKVTLPSWFTESEGYTSVGGRSVFDY